MDAGTPERIGPYEVLGELGVGGMGVVLLAWDPRLDRRVALKSLSAQFAGNPDAVGRLLAEATGVGPESELGREKAKLREALSEKQD